MNNLSLLPSIHEVDRQLKRRGQPFGTEARTQVQQVLEALRNKPEVLEGMTKPGVITMVLNQLCENVVGLQPVINLTGTIIHTNLGRSVFSTELLESLTPLFSGYCDLEFDTSTGKRGQRVNQAEELLCQLTGAEAALLVNNNAAAVMLCLHVLAQGKEVLLSRGEMVEIGGSFRVPEILTASGAKLKELGTTNKTKLADYQQALSDSTALVLKVHRSNFTITGFTEEVGRKDLAGWAKQIGIPVIEDLGSGALDAVILQHKTVELGLKEVLSQGVSLVTASGDKLLGGPQAGLILGDRLLIKQLKNSPMYRCLRCDKITLHLLEQTLLAYARKQPSQIPSYEMFHRPIQQLKDLATRIRTECPALDLAEVNTTAAPGGGSLPGESLESIALQLRIPGLTAHQAHQRLREQQPAIVARVHKDQLLLDMRTLLEFQVPTLVKLLNQL